ncbi:MAG: hypothetical protein R3A44_06690 [Caldilineaceae bacterium]
MMFMQRKGGLFKAGQAPTCWQQQIGRAASRVHTLATACAWLEKLAVTRPRLRTEPLLGHCLEAVANQEPPPVVEDTSAPASKSGRAPAEALAEKEAAAPNAQPVQPAGRRAKLAAFDHQSQPHPALTEPKRADRALLHRLAGQSIAQPKSPKSVSPPSSPPATRHPSPAPISEPTQAKVDLAEQLSQRVASRLHRQNGKTLSTPKERPHKNEVSPSSTGKTARLAQQWAHPLDGQRAAVEQLQYWSQRQRQVEATQPEAQRASASNPAPVTDSATRHAPMPAFAPNRPTVRHASPPASNAPLGQGHRDDAMNGNTLAQRQGAVAPAAVASADAQSDQFGGQNTNAGGHHAAADANDVADNAPLVAPPQIAQKLPKLTAPQAPDHAPTPIAAVTARQGALSNLLSDDDLSGLAANIKRILDAEARRYGIDV